MQNLIKITKKNREKITELINEVEGSSQVNLLSADFVFELRDRAEKKLNIIDMPLKYRSGAEYYYCPEGPYVNSYKYKQGATSITITRGIKDWFIYEITRTGLYPKADEINKLYLNQDQDDIAVKNFRKKNHYVVCEK